MNEDLRKRITEAITSGSALDLSPEVSDAELLAHFDTHAVEVPGEVIRAVIADLPDFRHSRHFTLRGARITGDLSLVNVESKLSITVKMSIFEGPVDFEGSMLRNLTFIDCDFTSFAARFLRVESLELERCTFTQGFRGTNAQVARSVIIRQSSFRNPGGDCLDFAQATVFGNFVAFETSFHGKCWMLAVKVSGQTRFERSALHSSGDCLSLDAAEIDGGLFFEGCNLRGGVRALGARLGGQMSFEGSVFRAAKSTILFDRLKLMGSLRILRTNIHGEFRALGSKIEGQFAVENSRISNPSGDAVSLDRSTIGSTTFLETSVFVGELRFHGVAVSGQVIVATSDFRAPGAAIRLELVRAAGSVHLKGNIVRGELSMMGLEAQGQVIIDGGALLNEGGDALALDAAHVHGLARISTIVSGRIRLLHARIDGPTVIDSCAASGDLHVDAGVATFETLSFKHPNHGLVRVDLARARIGRLDTHQLTNVRLAGSVGVEIGSLIGPLRSNPKLVRRFLKPKIDGESFHAGVWSQLADAMERSGEVAAARSIRISAAWRNANKASPLVRPWHWLYGILVGHGYLPMLSLVWLAVLLALTTMVVWANSASFVPSDPLVAARYIQSGLLPDYFPTFNPLLFAADTAIPFASSVIEDSWQLHERPRLEIVLVVLRGASWALIALLLGGITGLLKKQ